MTQFLKNLTPIFYRTVVSSRPVFKNSFSLNHLSLCDATTWNLVETKRNYCKKAKKTGLLYKCKIKSKKSDGKCVVDCNVVKQPPEDSNEPKTRNKKTIKEFCAELEKKKKEEETERLKKDNETQNCQSDVKTKKGEQCKRPPPPETCDEPEKKKGERCKRLKKEETSEDGKKSEDRCKIESQPGVEPFKGRPCMKFKYVCPDMKEECREEKEEECDEQVTPLPCQEQEQPPKEQQKKIEDKKCRPCSSKKDLVTKSAVKDYSEEINKSNNKLILGMYVPDEKKSGEKVEPKATKTTPPRSKCQQSSPLSKPSPSLPATKEDVTTTPCKLEPPQLDTQLPKVKTPDKDLVGGSTGFFKSVCHVFCFKKPKPPLPPTKNAAKSSEGGDCVRAMVELSKKKPKDCANLYLHQAATEKSEGKEKNECGKTSKARVQGKRCKREEAKPKKDEDPCGKEKEGTKQETKAKKERPCGKEVKPKKEDPSGKEMKKSKKEEGPCETPTKRINKGKVPCGVRKSKSEDPCGTVKKSVKKDDPCGSELKRSKSEDPCNTQAKKSDKTEDPCGKSKTKKEVDPCGSQIKKSKSIDPCGSEVKKLKEKIDPCGKPVKKSQQEDPRSMDGKSKKANPPTRRQVSTSKKMEDLCGKKTSKREKKVKEAVVCMNPREFAEKFGKAKKKPSPPCQKKTKKPICNKEKVATKKGGEKNPCEKKEERKCEAAPLPTKPPMTECRDLCKPKKAKTQDGEEKKKSRSEKGSASAVAKARDNDSNSQKKDTKKSLEIEDECQQKQREECEQFLPTPQLENTECQKKPKQDGDCHRDEPKECLTPKQFTGCEKEKSAKCQKKSEEGDC